MCLSTRYKSFVDIGQSSSPVPRAPPIHTEHTDVYCAARNGFALCGRIMREQGATVRTLDGEALDLWTAESLARQRALRAAVLIDAIRCLVGAAGMRGRRARQSALRWILSCDAKAPFSFNNVCEELGLDPSRLRRSLLKPAVGADGVPRIALGGERPAGMLGRLVMRRPRRDRSRYIVLDDPS